MKGNTAEVAQLFCFNMSYFLKPPSEWAPRCRLIFVLECRNKCARARKELFLDFQEVEIFKFELCECIKFSINGLMFIYEGEWFERFRYFVRFS